MKKFYMIQVVVGESPNYWYYDRIVAEREALIIALEQKKRVYILEVICSLDVVINDNV